MTEVRVSYPLDADLWGRMRHAVLTFKDAHYGCVRRFIRSLGAQFRQHPLKFWNHRHISRFAILRCGNWISTDVKLMASKACIGPGNVLRLADPQSAVSEKPHEIGAIFRLPCARRANFLNRPQEFLSRRQLQSLRAYSHTGEICNRITEACSISYSFLKNCPQCSNRVVDH